MDQSQSVIWGQGAQSKTKDTANSLWNVENSEMEAMIVAFGKENHQTNFDWNAEYGRGFDAIDLRPRTTIESGVRERAKTMEGRS